MTALDRNKIQSPDFGRPHVVILGAGASRAAFPNGDRHGRKLPLMRDIVDCTNLSHALDEARITQHRDDFEKLYSDLVSGKRHSDLVAAIDRTVFDYFAGMVMPEEPTLYDYLVLSLRKKDVIATFNWDPFLFEALARNRDIDERPMTLYLHGNVATGVCIEHEPFAVGARGRTCHRCGKPLQDSRLLYPVAQKHYNKDPFIEKNWELLELALADAYILTIFGYGAPQTDVEAVALLKAAWGDPQQRNLEQIEIIDIKGDDELYRTWEPFIHSHHYDTTNSFYESTLGKAPRRTCEAMWARLMEIEPPEPNPVPRRLDWPELRAFFQVLLDDERQHDEASGRPL